MPNGLNYKLATALHGLAKDSTATWTLHKNSCCLSHKQLGKDEENDDEDDITGRTS